MKKIEVENGERFGRWTVLHEVFCQKKGRQFRCRCDCGNERDVHLGHLRLGRSTQCFECSVVRHGMSGTPTYVSWLSMWRRCTRVNDRNWLHYGGKGISVCGEWKDFDTFYADMGERPSGHTIERKDVNLGYFKDNCKWATVEEQANNTTRNRIVKFEGKEYTCSQLAKHLGLNYFALWSRIKKGQKLDEPTRYSRGKQR